MTNLTDLLVPSRGAPIGVVVYRDEYLASGTWTKRAGAFAVYVEAIGGGNNGAYYLNSNANGGGGGEGVRAWLDPADLAATEAVTVGAGAPGYSAPGFVSNQGGRSYFGSHVEARGGGGVYNVQFGGDVSYAAWGGTGHIDDPDNSEPIGDTRNCGSGGDGSRGGSTFWGGAGGGAANASQTTAYPGGTSKYGGNGGTGAYGPDAVAGNGVQPGGGGGGASDTNETATGAGSSGSGADGAVYVTTYCVE